MDAALVRLVWRRAAPEAVFAQVNIADCADADTKRCSIWPGEPFLPIFPKKPEVARISIRARKLHG
jgi:hypothetical protein